MQWYPVLFNVTLRITLLVSLFLTTLLTGTLAHAGGGDFLWAKAILGSEPNYGYDIFADNSGNVYITGNFRGTADFDPGPGTFNLTSAGGSQDIFISKLSGPHSLFPWTMFVPAITDSSQP